MVNSPGNRGELVDQLERAVLEATSGELPHGVPLRVTKAAVSRSGGCPVRWRTEQARAFQWSRAAAVGTLTHRAIQLGMFWPDPDTGPGVWVRAAFESPGRDELADWMVGHEDPDMLGEVLELVGVFAESGVRERAANAAVEAGTLVELFDGRVVLPGRVDMRCDLDGRRVLIDWKSGAERAEYRTELAHYALLEACRGWRPDRVIGWNLRSGHRDEFEVDGRVLEGAVDGVARAVARMLGWRDVAPSPDPSHGCGWCPTVGCPAREVS
jgi:hypothetical protein